MGFPLPDWLFSWHAFLIALGLFIGFRHGFRGGTWLILILVGLAFEFQDYYPKWELHRFIFPGIVILVGIMFILNPNHGRYHWGDNDYRWKDKAWKHQWKQEWRQHRYGWRTGGPTDPTGNSGPTGTPGASGTPGAGPGPSPNPEPTGFGYTRPGTREDYVDTTTFFGGVHKKIVSKNFKGGDIVTIMGGTELDLSQADFTGMVKLDIVQVCGATKIIVPSNWSIRSEVTAIFAGFEDKRQQPFTNNPDKVLLIDGTSLMGGIELRNY